MPDTHNRDAAAACSPAGSGGTPISGEAMKYAEVPPYSVAKHFVSIPPPEVYVPEWKADCSLDNCNHPGIVGIRIETVRSITYCEHHAFNLDTVYREWLNEYNRVRRTHYKDYVKANLRTIREFNIHTD
jgi:hypothetical protein